MNHADVVAFLRALSDEDLDVFVQNVESDVRLGGAIGAYFIEHPYVTPSRESLYERFVTHLSEWVDDREGVPRPVDLLEAAAYAEIESAWVDDGRGPLAKRVDAIGAGAHAEIDAAWLARHSIRRQGPIVSAEREAPPDWIDRTVRLWTEDEALRNDPTAYHLPWALRHWAGVESLEALGPKLASHDGGDHGADLYEGGWVRGWSYDGDSLSWLPTLSVVEARVLTELLRKVASGGPGGSKRTEAILRKIFPDLEILPVARPSGAATSSSVRR